MVLLPSVRLACVRHAASVRSEPGSNSQVNFPSAGSLKNLLLEKLTGLLRSFRFTRKRLASGPPASRPKSCDQSRSRTIQDALIEQADKTLSPAAARASLPSTMYL